MEEYILALDQGTTSGKAILFNRAGKIISQHSKEYTQHYPKPGWVEHDAIEILENQVEVARTVIKKSKVEPSQIRAIGITNQRETTVLWDKSTGKPVYNAIVWQCRRTAEDCERLANEGFDKSIRRKTGLVLDAYFSGTKVMWILNNVPGIREKARSGNILFGTIDAWLIWNLTEGKTHATDYSNASRTLLFNIHELNWDGEILERFDIPEQILPDVRPSSGDFGTAAAKFFGADIPISGVAGDQHAALFGQCCFKPGMIKCTYGTGSFVLINTGTSAVNSANGLLTTIAWGLKDKVYYALEGSTFIAGAVIQWLRDEVGLLKNASESEDFALKVPDTGGVYLVPAFVGLGAPYWDMFARGTITGITRGTNKYHIVRAALEAIAYQTNDIVNAMLGDAKLDFKGLRVDGGAVVNNFLMQFQADILQADVTRPVVFETTALGTAYLAGLGVGLFDNMEEINRIWQVEKTFSPEMAHEDAEELYKNWIRAVERSKGWA